MGYDWVEHYQKELRGKDDEIWRLRGFAERVYKDPRVPAELHDAAAQLIGRPSLAHGHDSEGDGAAV